MSNPNGHNGDCPCIECVTYKGMSTQSSGIGIEINDPGMTIIDLETGAKETTTPVVIDPKEKYVQDALAIHERLIALSVRVDMMENERKWDGDNEAELTDVIKAVKALRTEHDTDWGTLKDRVDTCEQIGTKRDQAMADLQAEVAKLREELRGVPTA